MIQFDQVTKKYDNTAVVDDVSFTINEGEFFVIIGPSGSGKTTTLKMINRLIPLSGGSLSVDKKDIYDYNIQDLRFNIGYVLQQIALFPNMSVEENIRVVPEIKKWSEEEIKNRVTELLELVKLDPEKYRSRAVSGLSGGEQQRIGVARALAADPDILLMDEPFSALDPISRNSLQEDILNLKYQVNKTIVFVTHDMQEAVTLGDRIAIMKKGRVEQVGSVQEILHQPKNDFVKEFLQKGLPGYEEEKTVQALIDEDLYTPVHSISGERFELTDSVEQLTSYLSRALTAFVVLNNGQKVSISREQLLNFLANENQSSREEEA